MTDAFIALACCLGGGALIDNNFLKKLQKYQVVKIGDVIMSVRTSVLAIWLQNPAVQGMVT